MSGKTQLAVCDGAARTFGAGSAATVALAPTDCTIEPRASIALTGPSGSGKTTLLYLLAGLDAPTTGTVRWPALGARDALRPASVAMVFQGPSLIATLTAVENVALPLILAGIDDAAARAQACRTLDRLGLESLSAKLPQELSGGQAQRVAVARALAGAPRLLLADEPTGQLDSATGHAVAALLIDAARSGGAALVVSTHDPRIAALLEQRWEIADGELATTPAGVA